MNHIVLFGAGKSAGVLIKALLEAASEQQWRLTVADANVDLAKQKIGNSGFGNVLSLDVADINARKSAIASADLIISLLPPKLHILVARDCLELGRHLLTASYVDEEMSALHNEAVSRDLLFLCETGLDPGIDHMSAMRLINRIKLKGGVVTAFESHCGGLVAPENDDNPWHYKISWNPANVVNAGLDGASFLLKGQKHHLSREQLFDFKGEIDFPGFGRWCYYPNRDSIRYAAIYELESALTVMRTTIRHANFLDAWSAIVHSGLINAVARDHTFLEWSGEALKPFLTARNAPAIKFLGLLSDEKIPAALTDGAQVLQHLLETKLPMREQDKDLVLMIHEASYTVGNKLFLARSSFSMKGTDSTQTAMATTVGLPLARAAELILKKAFKSRGVQIPVVAEIYEPLLERLEKDNIIFQETDQEIFSGFSEKN